MENEVMETETTSDVEVIDLYPESEDGESDEGGIGTVAAMAIGAGITVAGIAAVKYGKRAISWLKGKISKEDDDLFEDSEEIDEDDEPEEKIPEKKTTK